MTHVRFLYGLEGIKNVWFKGIENKFQKLMRKGKLMLVKKFIGKKIRHKMKTTFEGNNEKKMSF